MKWKPLSLFLRCNCSWERGMTRIAVSSSQKQYMVRKQKMWEHLLQLAEEIQRHWIQFVLLAFWYFGCQKCAGFSEMNSSEENKLLKILLIPQIILINVLHYIMTFFSKSKQWLLLVHLRLEFGAKNLNEWPKLEASFEISFL